MNNYCLQNKWFVFVVSNNQQQKTERELTFLETFYSGIFLIFLNNLNRTAFTEDKQEIQYNAAMFSFCFWYIRLSSKIPVMKFGVMKLHCPVLIMYCCSYFDIYLSQFA